MSENGASGSSGSSMDQQLNQGAVEADANALMVHHAGIGAAQVNVADCINRLPGRGIPANMGDVAAILNRIERRLNRIDRRLNRIDRRVDGVREQMNVRFDRLAADLYNHRAFMRNKAAKTSWCDADQISPPLSTFKNILTGAIVPQEDADVVQGRQGFFPANIEQAEALRNARAVSALREALGVPAMLRDTAGSRRSDLLRYIGL